VPAPIDILMPVMPSRGILWPVLQGIARQDMPCRLIPEVSVGHWSRENEAQTRQRLVSKAYGGICLMMDSDIELPRPTDVREMVEYLQRYEQWDGIAISHREGGLDMMHVDIGCIALRVVALKKVDFLKALYPINCCCVPMNQQLSLTWLDDRRVIEHVA